MDTAEKRKQRKDVSRQGILKAAIAIIKKGGLQDLSMRKIANRIEYSATVIYEHFDNKEALLRELSRTGFLSLVKMMTTAAKAVADPREKLVNMWLAYWKFAFDHKEFYQLMFGIGKYGQTCLIDNGGSVKLAAMVYPVINDMLPDSGNDGFVTKCKYYAYWSVVHGLIALNFANGGGPEDVNAHVLLDTINCITLAEIHQV